MSLFLVGLIGLGSYAARLELRFSFFYLVPIALSSWYVGRRAGVLISIVSAMVWMVEYVAEHRLEPAGPATAYQNAPLLLAFFLILSLLLSALRRALGKEKIVARADPLTGVANRRAFFEAAEAEIRRSSRYRRDLTVAYLDLDDFKTVNDRYGHAAGDRVLLQVATAIRGSLRFNDLVARIGGDEFIILLPETGAEQANAVLRKVRLQLEEALRRDDCPVTASVGSVTFERPPDSVDEVVRLSDELMYSVKTSGKNRLATRTIGEGSRT
jgi:diguanylate cyclase (GGDEF)-like protein